MGQPTIEQQVVDLGTAVTNLATAVGLIASELTTVAGQVNTLATAGGSAGTPTDPTALATAVSTAVEAAVNPALAQIGTQIEALATVVQGIPAQLTTIIDDIAVTNPPAAGTSTGG